MSGDTKKWLKILFAVAMAAPVLAAIFAASGPFAQFGQGVSGYCKPTATTSYPSLDDDWKFRGAYRFASPTEPSHRIPDGENLDYVDMDEVLVHKTAPATAGGTNTYAFVKGNGVYGFFTHDAAPVAGDYPDLDPSNTSATGCGDKASTTAAVGTTAIDPTTAGVAAEVKQLVAIEQGSAIAGNSYGGILVVAVTLIPVGLLGVFFFKILGGTVGSSRSRRR